MQLTNLILSHKNALDSIKHWFWATVGSRKVQLLLLNAVITNLFDFQIIAMLLNQEKNIYCCIYKLLINVY